MGAYLGSPAFPADALAALVRASLRALERALLALVGAYAHPQALRARVPAAVMLAYLPSPALLALALAVIASAEALLCAVAVDKLHDGVRTDLDQELFAQGVGNTIAGVLGALPVTGVIVRSTANVESGATTRWSAVLHGVWLLLAVVALPFALEATATGVTGDTPYFASAQPRYSVAFPRYKILLYNTTDKTVTLDVYAYLTN